MFKFSTLISAVVAAAALSGAAQAATVLDQDSAPGGGNLAEEQHWQQEVTAGASGTLAGITLYGAGTNVLVSIARGPGFSYGPFEFSQFARLTSTGAFIDTSAANIILNAGDRFVIDLTQGSGGNIHSARSTYSGGSLFLNTNGYITNFTARYGMTLAFQTFMQSPAVPEPATWAMMIVGFGLTGSVVRRRRMQTVVQ